MKKWRRKAKFLLKNERRLKLGASNRFPAASGYGKSADDNSVERKPERACAGAM